MDQIDAIFDNCSSIEEILEDLRYGAMVIVVDDESRENEGDLQMVAEKVTPEDINFMAQHARGLICLSLTQSRCEALKLPLMVPDTDNDFSPNFTVVFYVYYNIDGLTNSLKVLHVIFLSIML